MQQSPTPQRPLVLGSTSRYRHELLARLNLPFVVAAPEVDETPLAEETPRDLALRLAVAKARAGRSATTAVQEGVQMHGGMGMTDAFEIGFFMKRARVLQELWGDSNFHLDALAQRRGY